MVSREIPETGDVEGFGITLAEASACGIPCIGSRSGGIPDAVVENKTGLLVDPLDVEDISNAIISLLQNPGKLKIFSENGVKRFNGELSWENIGKKIFNVGSASNNYSIKEIAEIASNIFPNIKINFIKKNIDQRNYKIDSSMLEKEIHFTKYKTINFGFEELKQQFEEGEITDYKNSCYSNIDSVSDLYCLT